MSGYVPREREPITGEQKVAMVAAVIASILLLISAIAASRWATPLLMKLDFGILPLGILQYVLAATYLMRPGSDPASRPLANTPRSRRLAALMCFILGTLIIAVWFASHRGGR
jgi:hypothetical protein